jgi:flagellar M-ring protein FliF
MAEPALNIAVRLKTLVRNLRPGQILALLMLIGSVVSALVIILMWAIKPEYSYLFTNLPQEDAGVIITQLKEKKIPYQIEAGGTSILVPKENIHELRLELASRGLPQGSGIGFEIFDNAKIGMTEFVQNVNYQRALQGELSRTINRFEEVESSRVHIVSAPKSLFVEDQEPSTASVVVKLKRGRSLNKNQIQSIVHLVSSSVPRLESKRVTVVDNYGNLLAGSENDSEIDTVSTEHLGLQHKMESDLEKRIRTMLDSVLGSNKAIVRVSCDLDFLKEEQTEETYLPDNKVVRSEQVMSETSGGSDMIPIGVPGLASNIYPQAKSEFGSGGKKSFLRQDKVMNYEIGKVIKRKILPIGGLLKMSIAVVVDGTYESNTDKDGNTTHKYVPRTEEELKKLENLVKRAANFDPQRGDQVEVANIPFETDMLDDLKGNDSEKGFFEKLGKYQILAKYGTAALAFILAFLFIFRPLYRWASSTSPWDVEVFKHLPKTLEEIEREYNFQAALKHNTLPAVNEASEIINNDQDRSVQLMRGWLNET